MERINKWFKLDSSELSKLFGEFSNPGFTATDQKYFSDLEDPKVDGIYATDPHNGPQMIFKIYEEVNNKHEIAKWTKDPNAKGYHVLIINDKGENDSDEPTVGCLYFITINSDERLFILQ